MPSKVVDRHIFHASYTRHSGATLFAGSLTICSMADASKVFPCYPNATIRTGAATGELAWSW